MKKYSRRTIQISKRLKTGFFAYANSVVESGPLTGKRRIIWINDDEVRNMQHLEGALYVADIINTKVQYLPDLEEWLTKGIVK